jgi:hydrogenase maturation protease
MTVIGMGNIDMGDDGVGVKIAEILGAQSSNGEWLGNTEIRSADGDPLLAAACLAEGKHVLLIDAVDMKRAPGAWQVFSATDVLPRLGTAGCSTHALSLAGVIELARGLGCADLLRILGVQVGDVRPGRFLSPRVRKSVPAVLAQIREEVEALP